MKESEVAIWKPVAAGVVLLGFSTILTLYALPTLVLAPTELALTNAAICLIASSTLSSLIVYVVPRIMARHFSKLLQHLEGQGVKSIGSGEEYDSTSIDPSDAGEGVRHKGETVVAALYQLSNEWPFVAATLAIPSILYATLIYSYIYAITNEILQKLTSVRVNDLECKLPRPSLASIIIAASLGIASPIVALWINKAGKCIDKSYKLLSLSEPSQSLVEDAESYRTETTQGEEQTAMYDNETLTSID
jgi:hypothetical protein